MIPLCIWVGVFGIAYAGMFRYLDKSWSVSLKLILGLGIFCAVYGVIA